MPDKVTLIGETGPYVAEVGEGECAANYDSRLSCDATPGRRRSRRAGGDLRRARAQARVGAGVDRLGQPVDRHDLHGDAALGLGEEREQQRDELRLGARARASRRGSRRRPARSARDTVAPTATRSTSAPTSVANCARARPVTAVQCSQLTRPCAPVGLRGLQRVPHGIGRQPEARRVQVDRLGVPEVRDGAHIPLISAMVFCHGHRHRRSRRGRQVHRRARRRASGSASRTWTRGRCTAASALAAAQTARPRRRGRRARRHRARRPRAARRRATSPTRSARPRSPRRASRVAADPAVRAALVAKQQAIVADGDWVAEGRDIGTVVAPDAAVKVFLTADPEERARRRARRARRSRSRTVLRRAARARRARPHRATAPRSRRRTDAVAGRHHRADARRGRRADRRRSPSRPRRSSA